MTIRKILAGIGISAVAALVLWAQNGEPQSGLQGAPGGSGGGRGGRGGRGGSGGGRGGGRGGSGGGRGGGGSAKLPTQAQWDSSVKGQEYVAKAKEIAGDDPDLIFDEGIFCKASGGASNQDRATIGVPNSLPHLEPYPTPSPVQNIGLQRLFDNFYWIGDSGVGTWLITTNDGYILFDTLNNEAEARNLLVPSMKKAGFDPAKIKYIVFGHFHGDHTGGGFYMQENYNPRVIMGREDWPLYFGLGAGRGGGTPAPQMRKDIDAMDGMKITVGDVTATIYTMTGHTPGSIGMIVPVKYQGKEHPILIVTAGTDFNNKAEFIGGYEHIWDMGIANKVESVMQVHPNTNMNLLARQKYVNDNYPPAVNPLLYGVERTRRYIEIMRACSEARIEALGW